MRDLDTRLDLEPGHGFAEVILGDIVQDLRDGDFSMILDGWNFDDPAKAEATLKAMFPTTAQAA